KRQFAQALEIAKESMGKFPENDIIKFNYAKSLLENGFYSETLKELENTVVLPHEGAMYGRTIYRKAAVLEGLQFLKEKKFEQALKSMEKARLWPENLGVGRPYDVDERIENFLEAECLSNLKETAKAQTLYQEIINYTRENGADYKSTDYLYVMALRRLNMNQQASTFLTEWQQKSPDNPALKLVNGGRMDDSVRFPNSDFELIKEISRYLTHPATAQMRKSPIFEDN
ncbi:MAG: hypothetical protein LBN71_10485, partial [Tannerella sp.]|nr:hypothetical protein [Tannerella sp.]